MLDVEFCRLYNDPWARHLMPCLAIFAIFTKVCHVFATFCRDFQLSLVMLSGWEGDRNDSLLQSRVHDCYLPIETGIGSKTQAH